MAFVVNGLGVLMDVTEIAMKYATIAVCVCVYVNRLTDEDMLRMCERQ